jgi:hypothetical protein
MQLARQIRLTFWLLMGLFLVGCGALDAPERLPLPTPVPTARPFDVNMLPSGEMVLDPVSDVVPKADPAIAILLEQVSQQQLIGYVQSLENFGTRNAFSDTESDNFGIGAARRWIFSELERVGNGRLQVRYDEFPLYYDGLYAPQSNVVATLPGSGPGNGVIILMAHYDTLTYGLTDGRSRAPGANDNASGIALLLESARLLSAHQWNQTIIFLATSAEEQGAFGARHFAQNAFFEGMNVLAAINYDGVGGHKGIPQYARLFAPEVYGSPSGQLARYYEYIAGLYLPAFPMTVINALDRDGRFGDQREFVNVGMPAIRVMQSLEYPELVNSVQDTWEKIDYNYLQQMVQLSVAVAATLAGAPMQPFTPQVEMTDALGMYQIRWPVEQGVAGYAISVRPVEEWAHPTFRFVKAHQAGNVALTGFDPNGNYVVSVAALDENGRLSYFSPEVVVGPNALALSP